MFDPAPRIERVEISATTAAAQRARDLQAAGRPIVRLTTGEPDFESPDHVLAAATAAMAAGDTHYTPIGGTPALRAAIQAKFSRENELDYKIEEILVGNGAKQIIFNALMAGLHPGDEVIVPAPYWGSYLQVIRLAGGEPVIIDTGPETGFKLTPEMLQAAITPKTRWLMLNSPSNPTGAMYSEAELAAMAQVLEAHPRIWVMMDDVYEHITFDGRRHFTMAQVAPQLKDRTLTINSVSKAYAMTGWRVGYCGGPVELIRAMIKMQIMATSGVSGIAQAAAVAALNGPQEVVAKHTAIFAARRELMLSEIGDTPGLACYAPEGAFYLYIDLSGVMGRQLPDGRTINSDIDFVDYLLDSHDLAVVAGAGFGLSPYLRLSFAASDEELKQAARQLRAACASLVNQ